MGKSVTTALISKKKNARKFWETERRSDGAGKESGLVTSG